MDSQPHSDVCDEVCGPLQVIRFPVELCVQCGLGRPVFRSLYLIQGTIHQDMSSVLKASVARVVRAVSSTQFCVQMLPHLIVGSILGVLRKGSLLEFSHRTEMV